MQLGNSAGEPAIRSASYSPPSGWERAEWLVKGDRGRKALEYSIGTTGTEEAKAFVEATDFSARHVLVHQQTFGRCRSLQLEQLLWRAAERTASGGFEIAMEYGPGEREVRCPDDVSEYALATMVRVPSDIERITRFTSGTVNVGPDDC